MKKTKKAEQGRQLQNTIHPLRKKRIMTPLAVLVWLGVTAAYSQKGDAMHYTFNRLSNAGTPYAQRDVIAVESTQAYHAAIAADYILQTGEIRPHADLLVSTAASANNLRIEWQRADSFTHAMSDVMRGVLAASATSPQLTALRHAETWDAEAQQAWNGEALRLINRELIRYPLLSLYRSRTEDKSLLPTPDLNMLSSDLDQHRAAHELDCKQLAAIHACLLQVLAQSVPAANRPRYYYISGNAEIDVESNVDDSNTGHAYVVSVRGDRITDVIETTLGSHMRPMTATSFEAFLQGQLLVGKSGAVYGFDFSHAEADAARETVGAPVHHEWRQPTGEPIRLASYDQFRPL